MKLILIFFSLFALKTCHTTQNILASQNENLTGSFVISSISDSIVSDHKLTIEFNAETQQVSGFSGCNRFYGTYIETEKGIKIGPLASTKMFCDETSNNIESKLMENLSKVNSVKIKDGVIEFLSNEQTIIKAVKISEQSYNVSVEYSAHSRGTFKHITINKKNISAENKRDSNPIVKACNEASWNALLKALKLIDIENIPNLKAPSEKRFFDGAAIANLKIIYNGKTYKTPSFDHGNPPEEIAELVKEILSISENIE